MASKTRSLQFTVKINTIKSCQEVWDYRKMGHIKFGPLKRTEPTFLLTLRWVTYLFSVTKCLEVLKRVFCIVERNVFYTGPISTVTGRLISDWRTVSSDWNTSSVGHRYFWDDLIRTYLSRPYTVVWKTRFRRRLRFVVLISGFPCNL